MSTKYLEQRQLSAAVYTNRGQNMTSSALKRMERGCWRMRREMNEAVKMCRLIQLCWTFAHLSSPPPPPLLYSNRLGLFQQDRDLICFTKAKSALTTVIRNYIERAAFETETPQQRRGGKTNGFRSDAARLVWTAPNLPPLC